MLRTLALLLVLANLAFWAYTQGHLAVLGLAPSDPREPHRLAMQVAPEAVVVLNATARATPQGNSRPAAATPATPTPLNPPPAASPPAAEPVAADLATQPPDAQPSAPTGPSSVPVAAAPVPAAAPPAAAPAPAASCWQASGLPRAQEVLVRAALENMDGMQGRWSLAESVLPARWVVYLGPFPSEAALQQRRSELRRAGIDHRELSAPGLAPGLALGTYSTQEAAQRALGDASRQGISGARVAQERPDTPVYTLRLDGVSDAQRRRIEAMGILRDRPLQRCP